MKKTLFSTILLLLLLPLASRAQHFEWATGYGGTIVNDEGCFIKGSVTDDEGNLYILGQFDVNDTWNNGPRLLPMAPYGPGHTTVNTLIAKISPSGEMLWKKVLHENNGRNTFSYDIKKVGDTAFACLVDFSLPAQSTDYCYYLDTLITSWGDYPIPSLPGHINPNFTALLVFGFDGEVKEQHFIQSSLVDSAGNDNMTISGTPAIPDWINTRCLVNPTFDIDSEGNIYIARQASDVNGNLGAMYGNVLGVKFWVDNRYVGMTYTHGTKQGWTPHILKFSPHFDTLLADRYVVQKSNGLQYAFFSNNIKLDQNGNLYFNQIISDPNHINDTLIIDSISRISVFRKDISHTTSYLVKYNSSLEPQYCLFLKDSIVGPIPPTISTVNFYDLDFDSDSNRAFINGFVQKNQNSTSLYCIEDTPLALTRNDAFVISFDMETGQYLSSCIVPSSSSSNLGTNESSGNLKTRNNRVFLQTQYFGNVILPDETLVSPANQSGMCLMMFDYAGHVIGGIDYHTHNVRNRPGPINMQDNFLYLCNRLKSDATFGDIHLSVNERMASIAKYVDTSFMTPYVYTGDTGDVRIALTPDVGAFTSYPNPFRQRVWIRVENASLLSDGGSPTALLTDLQGRQETVRLEPQGDGRYLLDLSSRPQASYILTLTTADGHQHSLTLLSQHDRFGN